MKLKGLINVIIVMWVVLNLKDMQWDNPHIFTKIVVMVAVLWLFYGY